jgi:hypothetical protein
MGLKLGGIDIGQIIENDFRISVLEHLLEWILKTNEGQIIPPSKQVVDEIRQKVFKDLQKRYPKSGLSMKVEK